MRKGTHTTMEGRTMATGKARPWNSDSTSSVIHLVKVYVFACLVRLRYSSACPQRGLKSIPPFLPQHCILG